MSVNISYPNENIHNMKANENNNLIMYMKNHNLKIQFYNKYINFTYVT